MSDTLFGARAVVQAGRFNTFSGPNFRERGSRTNFSKTGNQTAPNFGRKEHYHCRSSKFVSNIRYVALFQN